MTDTISGLTVVVVLDDALLGVAAATSMPRMISPFFFGAVNIDGSILKFKVDTWLAVVTEPGMIAKVLPWPAS